jgi:hypothetical protein
MSPLIFASYELPRIRHGVQFILESFDRATAPALGSACFCLQKSAPLHILHHPQRFLHLVGNCCLCPLQARTLTVLAGSSQILKFIEDEEALKTKIADLESKAGAPHPPPLIPSAFLRIKSPSRPPPLTSSCAQVDDMRAEYEKRHVGSFSAALAVLGLVCSPPPPYPHSRCPGPPSIPRAAAGTRACVKGLGAVGHATSITAGAALRAPPSRTTLAAPPPSWRRLSLSLPPSLSLARPARGAAVRGRRRPAPPRREAERAGGADPGGDARRRPRPPRGCRQGGQSPTATHPSRPVGPPLPLPSRREREGGERREGVCVGLEGPPV